MRDFGQGQFLGECRGGRGEGGNARGDRVGDIERVQAPQLFAERAPDRQIAGMQARDVLAAIGRARDLRDDLVERHRRRIDDAWRRAGSSRAELFGTSEPA